MTASVATPIVVSGTSGDVTITPQALMTGDPDVTNFQGDYVRWQAPAAGKWVIHNHDGTPWDLNRIRLYRTSTNGAPPATSFTGLTQHVTLKAQNWPGTPFATSFMTFDVSAARVGTYFYFMPRARTSTKPAGSPVIVLHWGQLFQDTDWQDGGIGQATQIFDMSSSHSFAYSYLDRQVSDWAAACEGTLDPLLRHIGHFWEASVSRTADVGAAQQLTLSQSLIDIPIDPDTLLVDPLPTEDPDNGVFLRQNEFGTMPATDLASLDFDQHTEMYEDELGFSYHSPWLVKETEFVDTAITNIAKAADIVTATTATAHGLIVGSPINVNINDVALAPSYNGSFQVTGVPSSTTFTYTKLAGTITSAAVTGTVRGWTDYTVGSGNAPADITFLSGVEASGRATVFEVYGDGLNSTLIEDTSDPLNPFFKTVVQAVTSIPLSGRVNQRLAFYMVDSNQISHALPPDNGVRYVHYCFGEGNATVVAEGERTRYKNWKEPSLVTGALKLLLEDGTWVQVEGDGRFTILSDDGTWWKAGAAGSGARELKLKLEDGTWAHAAWMVPV